EAWRRNTSSQLARWASGGTLRERTMSKVTLSTAFAPDHHIPASSMTHRLRLSRSALKPSGPDHFEYVPSSLLRSSGPTGFVFGAGKRRLEMEGKNLEPTPRGSKRPARLRARHEAP